MRGLAREVNETHNTTKAWVILPLAISVHVFLLTTINLAGFLVYILDSRPPKSIEKWEFRYSSVPNNWVHVAPNLRHPGSFVAYAIYFLIVYTRRLNNDRC